MRNARDFTTLDGLARAVRANRAGLRPPVTAGSDLRDGYVIVHGGGSGWIAEVRVEDGAVAEVLR